MFSQYCGGHPCEMPSLIEEAERAATIVMSDMSEDGFDLLESTAEIPAQNVGVSRYINDRNTVSEQSYESISKARDAIRQRLIDYGLCSSIVDGTCPVFSE